MTTEQLTTAIPYFGVFDLFKIGIGPSSSHSVGPMRAAEAFLSELTDKGKFASVHRVQVDLFRASNATRWEPSKPSTPADSRSAATAGISFHSTE